MQPHRFVVVLLVACICACVAAEGGAPSVNGVMAAGASGRYAFFAITRQSDQLSYFVLYDTTTAAPDVRPLEGSTNYTILAMQPLYEEQVVFWTAPIYTETLVDVPTNPSGPVEIYEAYSDGTSPTAIFYVGPNNTYACPLYLFLDFNQDPPVLQTIGCTGGNNDAPVTATTLPNNTFTAEMLTGSNPSSGKFDDATSVLSWRWYPTQWVPDQACETMPKPYVAIRSSFPGPYVWTDPNAVDYSLGASSAAVVPFPLKCNFSWSHPVSSDEPSGYGDANPRRISVVSTQWVEQMAVWVSVVCVDYVDLVDKGRNHNMSQVVILVEDEAGVIPVGQFNLPPSPTACPSVVDAGDSLSDTALVTLGFIGNGTVVPYEIDRTSDGKSWVFTSLPAVNKSSAETIMGKPLLTWPSSLQVLDDGTMVVCTADAESRCFFYPTLDPYNPTGPRTLDYILPNNNVFMTPEEIVGVMPVSLPLFPDSLGFAYASVDPATGFVELNSVVTKQCGPAQQWTQFDPAGGSCKPCLGGQYKNTTDWGTCKLCPLGTYSSLAVTSLTSCVFCNVSFNGLSGPSLCPSGSQAVVTSNLVTDIACSKPWFVNGERLELEGSFYVQQWPDMLIVVGVTAIILAIICFTQVAGEAKDMLVEIVMRFQVLEHEEDDSHMVKLILAIVSACYVAIVLLLLCFFVKVLVSDNTSITASMQPLKALREYPDTQTAMLQGGFRVSIVFYGSLKLTCEAKNFRLAYTGIVPIIGSQDIFLEKVELQNANTTQTQLNSTVLTACEVIVHVGSNIRTANAALNVSYAGSLEESAYIQFARLSVASFVVVDNTSGNITNWNQYEFECEEDFEATPAQTRHTLCGAQNGVTFMSTFIAPPAPTVDVGSLAETGLLAQSGAILRGDLAVSLLSQFDVAENCDPVFYWIPFTFHVTRYSCYACPSSSVSTIVSESEFNLKQAFAYYVDPPKLNFIVKFVRSPLMRKITIQESIPPGQILFGFIITAVGIKHVLEFIHAVVNFFLRSGLAVHRKSSMRNASELKPRHSDA